MLFKLVICITLLSIVSCALNLNDIETLLEETATTDLLSGRLLFDAPRNRIIVTSEKAVYFIDSKTRIAKTFLLSYKSLAGEFVDENGHYHVFADTGPSLTRFTIQPDGRVIQSPVVALKSISCSVWKDNTHLFVVTKDALNHVIASYDFVGDKILGSIKLTEPGGDSCAVDGQFAYFTTVNYLVKVDMTDLTSIKSSQIKLTDTTHPIPPKIAIDPVNKFLYSAEPLSANAIQYNMVTGEINFIRGDPYLYTGYHGLAVHPTDGSVYLFSSPNLQHLETNTMVLETTFKLQAPNSFGVPNALMFTSKGVFDTSAKRLYVVGFRGKSGHMSLFSIGTYFFWGLSKEAIIGISVGAGVLLLCMLSAILVALYAWRSKKHRKSEEERMALITDGRHIASA